MYDAEYYSGFEPDIEADEKQLKINKTYFRFFKVNGSDREFMYLIKTPTRQELDQYIEWVKGQGDIYRVTKEKTGYVLWDARV